MTNHKTEIDKLICVGKNYLEHALELGDAVPERPFYFFKPPSCLIEKPVDPVPIPRERGALHHELEIVYRIRRDSKGLRFDGMTLGLDLTLRDLQNELKKKGQPWEASKAFPNSAVIGDWLDYDPSLEIPFDLAVNGEIRQSGRGAQMRTRPDDLLRDLDRQFTVCDGDLLFTGTPKGVGPILAGDALTLRLGDRLQFTVRFR